VLVDRSGAKLSKQNLAPALDLSRARQNLHAVLTLLRLEPPPALRHEAVRTQLDWATPRWSLAALQGCRSLPVPERLAD
jgi:glutamyl-Q tRNA(Asp) synthetase